MLLKHLTMLFFRQLLHTRNLLSLFHLKLLLLIILLFNEHLMPLLLRLPLQLHPYHLLFQLQYIGVARLYF